MSTDPGNNGRPGAASGSAKNTDNAGNPTVSDGGQLRDRSDRLASSDDTQVLPSGTGRSETPSGGATAAGASAGQHDDAGSTRAMPLSATKDPNADYGTGSDSAAGRRSDNDPADSAGGRNGNSGTALPGKANREALLAMEKERFGGIKFGAAFFGWLTATGMVVLLSALAAAIGAAVGFSTENDLGQSLDQAMANQSAGVIGVVILLVILLLAYYAGGYVAGRMARFNGLKQGLAVWLWAVVAGVIVVVLGLIFGNDIRSITQLNTVAPLPEDLDGATAVTWIAIAATLAATLIGALLGGLAGMRYHRRIDRADFSDADARG